MARVLLTTLLIALVALMSGCGDDSEDRTGSTSTSTTSTSASGSSTEVSATDRSEIEQTIKAWLLQGDCDLMTDTFLEDQTFIGKREEACKTFETIFTKPNYDSSDIVITDVEAAAGGNATALVGDDSSEITSEYELVQENGDWLIDSAGA